MTARGQAEGPNSAEQQHLDELYAAEQQGWLDGMHPPGFEEALTDARAAGARGHREALGRGVGEALADATWRSAFRDAVRDRTMTRLRRHRNGAGLGFNIWWSRVALPDDDPYWLHRIDARLPDGNGHVYTVRIRKLAYRDAALADAFLLTEPWAAVKAELEQADEAGVPILFPIKRDDWQMYF